ncbi:MAG TPA: 50S ribosomal protein L32 [Alphaproteobacteria bacterium]|nr:50S ribosomal protein L32 [Alphaproteobacteria bacterium]
MAVPKKKTSPGRKGMRQQRHARAEVGTYTENQQTGTLTRRHHLSREADGSMYYGDRLVKAAKVKAAPAAETPAE